MTDPTNPDYVDSFTNEKDRIGLIGKLDSASAKLSQGKLDPADGEVLLAEVNEAIACVEGLQAQTSTVA